MLLLDLDADQIEQALALQRAYRDRFAKVAKEVLQTAETLDIEPAIARATIIGECLLLAAYMSNGSREGFHTVADWALDKAEETQAKEAVGQS